MMMLSKDFDISEILDLLSQASRGKDNIERGAVGHKGYSFVIRNVDNFREIYVPFSYQTYELVGDMHNEIKDRKEGKFILDNLYRYFEINALLIGSLKTILPSLKFWDAKESDILFEVVLIIKTPEGKIFPLIYYYDRYRMALGTCKVNLEIFNFDPRSLSQEERFDLAEVFENALKKVPLSDYKTIYPGHDEPWHIGVINGRPFFTSVF
ncbi:MAG: hypothetical protein EU529_16260 [Promethearchaeota archaeon]|nr:MAG: hypothetical protein EU529_16260 [Candidatus Lokiarchaeota archaeon]